MKEKSKKKKNALTAGELFVEKIRNNYPDEKIWCATGYEDAVLGYDEEAGKLVYSVKKAQEICIGQMTVTKADLNEEEIEAGMTIREKRCGNWH